MVKCRHIRRQHRACREFRQPRPSGSPEVALEDRATPRHQITIIGRVRTGSGARDVTILDLSEKGCRFHDKFGTLAEGTPVTIKFGTIAPVEATVKWRDKETVGVEFGTPLYPAVLDHIRAQFGPGGQ